MKKLVLLLLIINITLSLNILSMPLSHAEDTKAYSDTKKTELISTYIKNLKKEINIFKKRYEIENNESLENEVLELDNLLNILNNLNKKIIWEQDKEKIIKIILEKLKKSKDIIKNILKIKKTKYEKEFNIKREFYLKIWDKLNKQINNLIVNVYDVYKNIDYLWEKETSIIILLKDLNKESLKLKNFKFFNFNTQTEMSTSMVRILKNIKNDILELKKIW